MVPRTSRPKLQEGDELVILAAVPRSKGDDVKGDLRIDDVVEGGRLVVEHLGVIHRVCSDEGGFSQAGRVGIHILDEGGSAHDTGAVGGGEVDHVCRRNIVVPDVHTFSGPGLKVGTLSFRDVCEGAEAEDADARHVVVLAEHLVARGVAVQSLSGQPVFQPCRMVVGASQAIRWESRSRHYGLSKVADVTQGLLRRTVPHGVVGRRADGGDPRLAAPLQGEVVGVLRLGVTLDGDVLQAVVTLLDVVEELVERIGSPRFLLEEVCGQNRVGLRHGVGADEGALRVDDTVRDRIGSRL